MVPMKGMQKLKKRNVEMKIAQKQDVWNYFVIQV